MARVDLIGWDGLEGYVETVDGVAKATGLNEDETKNLNVFINELWVPSKFPPTGDGVETLHPSDGDRFVKMLPFVITGSYQHAVLVEEEERMFGRI